MEFIITELECHSHAFKLALLKSPREVSGGVSFLQDNRFQFCNFAHNVLSQKKTMFKVINRNTRKRCLLI